MIVTKKAIPRRTVLRGLGVTLALPLLDGMVPALSALAKTAAKAKARLGVVYVPNGVWLRDWTPRGGEGAAFEFSPILQPLAPFRERLLVLTGLNGTRGGGSHAGAATRFLTDTAAKYTRSEVEAGISMDQLAAQKFGRETQFASLELALESSESAGTCDVGYSCAYTNTICWRSATTPLPMENNPRTVFERLFGDTGSTDAALRLARIQDDRSILDSVTQKVAQLQRRLGPGDRTKISEYLEAVRDVERRIQKAEEQSDVALPLVAQPAGIPPTLEEHAKLMFDLQVLAYQCDLTRVITFMIGREFSGRTFPELGVSEAHHSTSHHVNDPVKIENNIKINTYHVKQLAYFLEKLRSTPDGEGSLLDQVMILYGAGMSDGNSHSPVDLPIVLAGGGAGQLTGGRHIHYTNEEPLADLHVTLLDKLGVPVERIGNSTGNRLNELSI